MSFEALPNELLVKIFSYSSWNSLRDLTLVNRRWNQVIGELATLNLSKESHTCQEVSCIPLEVLCGSLRKYNKISCYLSASQLQTMSGTFVAVLEFCRLRNWKVNILHITSHYDQFNIFLQTYEDLSNDVVTANIRVIDCPFVRERYKGSADVQLTLRMEKLRQLNLVYEASSFCSLSLHAPELEFLEVERCVFRNNFHLTFNDSTELRSLLFRNSNRRGLIHQHDFPNSLDPAELQNALLTAPKITRIEITGYSIATTFSAMFGKLQTIILRNVTLTPTSDPLHCLNLTRLELRGVRLRKPLKIRVPQLRTLICDNKALTLLHLQDTFEADLLAIDLNFDKHRTYYEMGPSFQERFSSFRRLHLLLWDTTDDHRTTGNDNISISWLLPYISAIMDLTLQSNCWDRYFHQLRNICKHLPQLKSLRLLGMELPEILNFIPFTVQQVTIEDCSFDGSIMDFPPTVARVNIRKLWKLKEAASSRDVMILLPMNQFAPLESEIVPVQEFNDEMVSRTAYSSKDWHKPDDMEHVFPLPPRHFVRRCQTELYPSILEMLSTVS